MIVVVGGDCQRNNTEYDFTLEGPTVHPAQWITKDFHHRTVSEYSLREGGN